MNVGKSSELSAEERREIVLALVREHKTMTDLCREHQLSTTTIYKWRDAFLDGGLRALQGTGPSQREATLERENEKLKSMIGDYALANYVLKKGVPRSTGRKGGRV